VLLFLNNEFNEKDEEEISLKKKNKNADKNKHHKVLFSAFQ
jgi:hypothetical protein